MNEKEKAFWQLIQNEAEKKNSAFYMDSGEGHEIFTDMFEGEDFSGWLIPHEHIPDFQKDWNSGSEDNDKWERFYCFAEWKEIDGVIKIEFKAY